MSTENTPTSAQAESRNIAILVWIGTIFFWFLPGLIVYLVKKDDEFVTTHAKEAINVAITGGIAWFASAILMIVLIGILLIWVVAVWYLVVCILAAVAASNNKPYRAPFVLRLIK